MTAVNDVSLKNLIVEALYFFSLILAAIIAVNILDRMLLGYVWGGSSRPNFEMLYLIRTACVGVVALFFISFVIFRNPVSQFLPLTNDSPKTNSSWPWVTLSKRSRQLGLLIVLIFSIFYLMVFFYDPLEFREISSDQKFVENFSALFSFSAFIIFLITGFVNHGLRKQGMEYKFYAIFSWFFSVAFFVICMEEIAWMQGIFFFDTPEFFKNNAQKETNIHNYYTYYFELSYYFSTFLFFVVVPFYYDHRPTLARTPLIRHFLPSRLMIYIGAMAAAYNYDFWNNLYFQMSFFISLYILIYCAWIRKPDKHLYLLTALIIVFFVSQLSFVLFGFRVTRTPSFKEYKEFFIPLTFLYYSCEIYVRSRKLVKSKNIQ